MVTATIRRCEGVYGGMAVLRGNIRSNFVVVNTETLEVVEDALDDLRARAVAQYFNHREESRGRKPVYRCYELRPEQRLQLQQGEPVEVLLPAAGTVKDDLQWHA